MSLISKEFIHIRKEMGFKNLKSFYTEFISKRGIPPFNYPQYTRIEKGDITPSLTAINFMSSILDEKYSEGLIMAFCQEIFPKNKNLFSRPRKYAQKVAVLSEPKAIEKSTLLTPKQEGAICKSKIHYFIFLYSTLEREHISIKALYIFGKGNEVDLALKDLALEKIITIKNGKIYSNKNEFQFDNNLKQATEYKQLRRKWFSELLIEKKLTENLFSKRYVKRISPRYLDLILNQVDFLFSLLDSSDETQIEFNNSVIMLELNLSSLLPIQDN